MGSPASGLVVLGLVGALVRVFERLRAIAPHVKASFGDQLVQTACLERTQTSPHRCAT